MEKEPENKDSTSAFLWRAASSTAAIHPLVTANLLLKCKKELNASNVGVQFKHVSKANVCQSCGNPWSLGNYTFDVKKTFKTTTIRKILKKKAKREKEGNKKLSALEQHMVDRYNARKCSLLVKCGFCHQSTNFSMPLPRPMQKILKQNNTEVKTVFAQGSKITNSNQGKTPAIQNTNQKINNKKQKNQKQNLSNVVKTQGKQQQISKGQMKNLAAALNKNKKKQSALQSFLSSIK